MDNKDNENLEDQQQIQLDEEDKLRVIKGLILVFLFSSVGNDTL
jgi:hypothetical protein